MVYGGHDRVQEARVLAAAVDGTDGLVDVDGVAAASWLIWVMPARSR